MLLDAQAKLAAAVDVGASGTVYSTNAYDLGKAATWPGTGQPLHVLVEVTEEIMTGDTCTVNLITEVDETLDGSSVFLQELLIVPASAAIGTFYVATISPKHPTAVKQFLGLSFVSGASASAGKLNAWILTGPDLAHVLPFADVWNPDQP